MSSSLSSLQRRWDRRLNLGLAILWGLVIWRTGLVALGYATLVFIADIQAVVGPPLPQTLSTRHPHGQLVDLSVAQLRDAWWVAPHLDHAEQLFLSGATGSLLMWALFALVMLRHRARLDATVNARFNLVIDAAETLVLRRLPHLLTGCAGHALEAIVTHSRAGPAMTSDSPRQDAPEAEESVPELTLTEASEVRTGEPSLDDIAGDRASSSNGSGPPSANEAEGASPDGTAPATSPIYPTSFFTQF